MPRNVYDLIMLRKNDEHRLQIVCITDNLHVKRSHHFSHHIEKDTRESSLVTVLKLHINWQKIIYPNTYSQCFG